MILYTKEKLKKFLVWVDTPDNTGHSEPHRVAEALRARKVQEHIQGNVQAAGFTQRQRAATEHIVPLHRQTKHQWLFEIGLAEQFP